MFRRAITSVGWRRVPIRHCGVYSRLLQTRNEWRDWCQAVVSPVERNVVHIDECGDKLWSGAVWRKRRPTGASRLRRRRTSGCGSIPTVKWLVVHTSFDTRIHRRTVWQQRRSTDSECVHSLRYGWIIIKNQKKKKGVGKQYVKPFFYKINFDKIAVIGERTAGLAKVMNSRWFLFSKVICGQVKKYLDTG